MISNSVVLASACALQLFMAASAGEAGPCPLPVCCCFGASCNTKELLVPIRILARARASREIILKREYLEIKAAGVRHEPVGAGLTSCQPSALQGQLWIGDRILGSKGKEPGGDNAGIIFPIAHLHSSQPLTIPDALPWVVPISLQVPHVQWEEWVAQIKPREAEVSPPALYLKAGLLNLSGVPLDLRTHLCLWCHPKQAHVHPGSEKVPSPALVEPPGLTWTYPTLCSFQGKTSGRDVRGDCVTNL